MADEKLNPGQGEQIKLDISGESPGPDLTGEGPPAPEPGDVVVAGKNFGCGSSREHAPIALKASQVSCVIAKTFARIFYRNSINIGFPILECPEAAEEIQPGDVVSVDFDSGLITDETTGKRYQAQPFPASIQKIIQSGGLLESIKG